MRCKDCSNELQELNPPIEDYIENKFVIRIPFTNWKFALVRDNIEYGCGHCSAEKKHDYDEKVFNAGMEMGYEKAMREYRLN